MRHSEKFHPEWGYLAPAPSFIRTARVVLTATAVGAIAGAGVVFSLVAHSSSENSIALRTLAKPAELSIDMRAGGQAEVTPITPQVPVHMVATRSTPQKISQPTLSAVGQLTHEAEASAHTNSTVQGHAGLGSAQSVSLPGNPTTVVPLVEATETPNIERVQKKATKKSSVTSHYAWRETRRWGGEYYRDRGWHYWDTW